MFTVKCQKCGKEYENKTKRSGYCTDCRKTRSQINTKYRDNNYDKFMVYLPKGKKDDIKAFLSEINSSMSMNEFCNKAIDAYCEKLYNESEKSKKSGE